MKHPLGLRHRLAAAVTACAMLLVTLTLLAGIPSVLWRATGVPWPDHVHSLSELGDRLMQPVTDPLVLEVLALIGWVSWSVFAATVVREVLWYAAHLQQLVRDRQAHEAHVATVSLKGSLAALCIGTLVLSLLSLWRPQAAHAHQASTGGELRPHTASSAPAVPGPASVSEAATAQYADTAHGPSCPAQSTASVAGGQVRHVEYVVGAGDTLWDIARTHLGDGIRWPRIYHLNKERVQDDGQRLVDPDVILPGWRLTLPLSKATPPAPSLPAPEGAEPPPNSSGPTAPPAPAPSPSPETDSHGRARDEAEQHARNRPVAEGKVAASRGPEAIDLGTAGLVGITAAAGLLAARRYWHLHQQRRRKVGDEAPLPTLSPHIGTAARAAHAAALLRRPDPDPLVTRRKPPQPPKERGSVTIGVRDDSEVPIDELAVPGGCLWTGPGAEGAARALLIGILTAAERLRPGPPRVTAMVTRDVADILAPWMPDSFSALAQYENAADAIRAAEQHLLAHAHHADAEGPEEPGTGLAPGHLVLIVNPEPAHQGQLQNLAARSRPGMLTVLTLSPLPGTSRWDIAVDGTTAIGGADDAQLSGSMRLFHLTAEAGRDMGDFLLTAHGRRPRSRALNTAAPAARSARRPEKETDEADDSGALAAPLAAEVRRIPPTRPTQAKAVRLHALGPITLYVRGRQDPVGTNMRPEAREFLALLAAHPSGLLASDITENLQLDELNAATALKNLRRAVRRTLRDASGIERAEFVLLNGEHHRLNPEHVECDLDDFTTALRAQRHRAESGEAPDGDLAAVRAVLAHYRGPFAHNADYPWADTLREHYAMKASDLVLGLAHRIQHIAQPTPGLRAAALELLEHLCSIHPEHERLAQQAIRMHQAAGRHDAARHTYARLQRHLADLGLSPEPATRALLATPVAAQARRHDR